MLIEIPSLEGVLILVAYVIVQTILLGLYLTIFKPGEQGRFARRGSFEEWLICFFFNCVMAVITVIAVLPTILLIILWWVMALWVLRLSIRQAFKLNIALGLCYLAMLVGVGSLLNVQ
jgi:hypothetical protein